MLHELLPGAMTIGVLVNPNAPTANVEPQVRDLQTAADALGLRLRVVNATNERDAEVAFASLVSTPVDALLVTSDGIFSQQLREPWSRLQCATVFPRCIVIASSSRTAD